MHACIQGYDVILEKGPASWGAYVPELPVCVVVADTREEVEGDIAKAITMHLEGLREDEQERDAVLRKRSDDLLTRVARHAG